MVSGLGESTTSGAVLGRSPEMIRGGTSVYFIAMFPQRSLIGHGCIPSMLKILIKQCLLGCVEFLCQIRSQCISSLTPLNIWMSEYFHQKYIPYPKFALNRLDPPVCPVAGAPQRV